MRQPALRAALRIARRDALRSPGRSILVVFMIALPVLAVSAADVLARTAELSTVEKIDKKMGAADAALSWAGGPTQQSPSGDESGSTGSVQPAPATAAVVRALPPGSQVIPKSSVRAAFATRDGVKVADLIGFDYAAPPVAGLIRQVSGRAPRNSSELALSRPLAEAIGKGPGDTVRTTQPQARAFRVVGIVEDPYRLKSTAGYTLPTNLPVASPARGPGEMSGDTWYVKTVRPVDWQQVLALNAEGYVVRSREVMLRPPPRSQVPYYVEQDATEQAGPPAAVEDIAILGLVVGMALLEVVLLAGPAFAVGARRKRRELALVAATGGDRRDVRNIVLAGGAVLGLTAAAVGVALGIGLAAALLPLLERLEGSVTGHFDIRPLELAGIGLVGVVTGLAAAYLPARSAARQDVVTALAGRRGAVRTGARVPLIGALLALAGAGIAIGGAVLAANTLAVLAGAIVAEVGLIVCTPALLGLAGRLGRWLPLSPRMALRDAARNRSSAAPAVAAIMAAVAGSVGIGIYVASTSAHDRASYQAGLRHGDAGLELQPGTSALAAQAASVLKRTLPAREVVVISGLPRMCGMALSASCPAVQALPPPARRCPINDSTSIEQARRLQSDPRCTPGVLPSYHYLPPVQIDDGTVAPTLSGGPATAVVTALRAGKVVVFDPSVVHQGKTSLHISNGTETERQVPAVAVTEGPAYASVVIPPELARSLGLPATPTMVYASNRTVPTERQEQAAQGALSRLGIEGYLLVERGYLDRYTVGLLALLIAAAVITLGASGIATALSNVDGRQDLVTLAAVGASPRVRRVLSMSRAGVIAILGTALGTVVGFVPPVGLILVTRVVEREASTQVSPGLGVSTYGVTALPLTVPWTNLAVTSLVVPAIAILIAGIFSRSRLPVERRTAT